MCVSLEMSRACSRKTTSSSCRMLSRGPDERSQMHAVSLLLSTREGMSDRLVVDEGANWIMQGSDQEQRDQTAGVKALCSMVASTTSGRAKELVKQGLSDRNGTVAFGRVRERFGKTAGVAKLSDVFQFQWTSSDSLEDKWVRWLKLMRQVSRTSWRDDAGDARTLVWRRPRNDLWNNTYFCVLQKPGSVVCKCGSVLAKYGGFEYCSAHANGNQCCRVNACCGQVGHEKSKCR